MESEPPTVQEPTSTSRRGGKYDFADFRAMRRYDADKKKRPGKLCTAAIVCAGVCAILAIAILLYFVLRGSGEGTAGAGIIPIRTDEPCKPKTACFEVGGRRQCGTTNCPEKSRRKRQSPINTDRLLCTKTPDFCELFLPGNEQDNRKLAKLVADPVLNHGQIAWLNLELCRKELVSCDYTWSPVCKKLYVPESRYRNFTEAKWNARKDYDCVVLQPSGEWDFLPCTDRKSGGDAFCLEPTENL